MSNEAQPSNSTPLKENNAHQTPRDVFDAAAHRRRRYVLSLLEERRRPISERDLATQIAAWERDKPLLDVTEDEYRAVHASLHHRHLPKLQEAGLIERDADERTVRAVDQSALAYPGLTDVDETSGPGRQETLDTLFAVLADERRRTILSILDEQRTSYVPRPPQLYVEELAEAVVDHEHGGASADGEDGEYERVVLTLRHQHLPKMADAGLVRYDPESATVTYTGHPELRDEWILPEPNTALLEALTADRSRDENPGHRGAD